MIFDILKDKKFNFPFLTIRAEKITMILHMKKAFFLLKQYPSCTKIIFAHHDSSTNKKNKLFFFVFLV